MGKRIFLFLVTNLAIVLTLTVVVSVLGVAGGPDIGSLAVFCLVWGMGGAFISLLMSRWIAKRATGVHLIDGRRATASSIGSIRPSNDSPARQTCRCRKSASTSRAR
jgi:heat shock protein HtpX